MWRMGRPWPLSGVPGRDICTGIRRLKGSYVLRRMSGEFPGKEKTGEETALEGIERTEEFFRKIGMPTSLSQLGIQPDEKEREALSLDATMGDTVKLTRIRPLGAKEVSEIYQMAM